MAPISPVEWTWGAQQVQESFIKKFYMPEKGYLKDVISGTDADEQIRCNQIWALSMTHTMLSPEQEKAVVDAVYAHLYTPCGLRTLSPEEQRSVLNLKVLRLRLLAVILAFVICVVTAFLALELYEDYMAPATTGRNYTIDTSMND